MKATCEREIFKLFYVTKCKGCYSFKLEKNSKRKILELNIFYLVKKIVRFHVDCKPQIRIVYLKSQCSQWGPWIGINGQLAVCFSTLLGFIQYNISVYCKLAQWRVADPVAFHTRRTTNIFGISGYVKLVTLYCHAIFWEKELRGGVSENNANRFLLRIND